MPSFDLFKMLNGNGMPNGRIRKMQSDDIMEQTWWEDIAAQKAYIYDYYHDDEPLQLNNLASVDSKLKTEIDVKYILSAAQTLDKDYVSFHIQLRPSQECNVDYYFDEFEDRFGTQFPLGLYIDLQDSKGKYNRWLIVDYANWNDPQFPTYQVLRCDYIYQWIYKGRKYQMAGVQRSQNSYNSGVWTAYRTTSPEDQIKLILPLNNTSLLLYHNQRMIIDAPNDVNPIAWKITKVHRLSPNGMCRITLAEEKYDQHRDFVEKDSNGKIIGMWADYYDVDNNIEAEPYDYPPLGLTSEITYSGMSPQLKLGGSYKTYAVSFYDKNGDETDLQSGEWSFLIDGVDASEHITVLTSADSTVLQENQIKIKVNNEDDLLGKILMLSYVSEKVTSELSVEIIGL